MKTIIGIILILASFYLGYEGYQKWDKNTASIEIGKLEISAGRQSGKNEAYAYIAGAVVLLAGGVFLIRKG